MKISRQQSDILNATTRGRMYIGSLASGKSYIMCINAIHEALKGRYHLIVSFSYRNLKDVVFPMIKEICEELGVAYTANISDMSIIINNIPILLRTAENPDRLRSFNLNSFACEEARELSREVFDILLGRLRKSETDFWSIYSTPRGKNWFYDIIKSEKLLDIFNNDVNLLKNENLTVVRSTIYDSPFLPRAYIKELERQYTTSFQQQELLALIIDTADGIIDTNWFKIKELKTPLKGVRFWDLAVSSKTTADYSSGCLLSKDTKYYINDIRRVKLQYPELRRLITETALSDGTDIILGFEKAGQQQAIIDDIASIPEIQRFTIKTVSPTKDLISRSYPWVSQLELGNFILNKAPWNRELLDECTTFKTENLGKVKDDQISSICGAYELINKKTSVQTTNLNKLWR